MGGDWPTLWNNGKKITDNKLVLSIVRNGFRKLFRLIPPLSSVSIRLSQSSSPLLREEVETLLQKRAVERVQDLSRLFLVPKRNGKLRPVINISLLNLYIRKQPFKMEIVKSVRQSIVINDWAVSIDLTDAYLHVPIHPQSRKYLRFVYEDRIFQFTAFRMSLSLWIFTKLMDVIASHLRQRSISVFPYLRRLADKRSDSQSTTFSDDILPSSGTKSRFHSKSKEVRFDIISEIHVNRHRISDTKKYSQGSSRPSQCYNSDYQNSSFPQSSFGTNFPFSFGQTQCSSRFCSPRQSSLRPQR